MKIKGVFSILIVEKQPTFKDVLDVIVIGRYQCVYVSTLEEAKGLIEGKRVIFDLVITEDELSDGSGLELVLICSQNHIACVGLSIFWLSRWIMIGC